MPVPEEGVGRSLTISASAGNIATVKVTGTGALGGPGTMLTVVEDIIVGASGTGTLIIDATTKVTSHSIILGQNATGSGTLQLNGGTIATSGFVKGAGNASLQLTSGTIRATANNSNYFDSFGDMNLSGVTFEINGGVAVTATNTFVGAMFKRTGPGTLKITEAINTAEVNFLNGTTVLDSHATITTTGTLNVTNDATLQMTLGNGECSHISATDINISNPIKLDLSTNFIYDPGDNPYSFNLFGGSVEGNLDPFAWFDFSLITAGWIVEDIYFNEGILSFNMYAIPEPSTYAMMVGGAGTLILLRRRRKVA